MSVNSKPNPEIQVKLTGFVTTTDPSDTFAITHPFYSAGGFKFVDDITDRDSILPSRRIPEITISYVESTGTWFQLQGGIANTDWVSLGVSPFGTLTAADIKSLYESNGDTNAFTDALKLKLDNIESNATADQTGTEIQVLYEAEPDRNAFTDALIAKLVALESSHFKGTYVSLAALQLAHPTAIAGDYADVDMGVGSDVVRHIYDESDAEWQEQGSGTTLTAAQVKILYESNPDTNAYTDAEKTKLSTIESNATADQTGVEIEAAYNGQVAIVAQVDAEAGTSTTVHRWTPERVKQAIEALGGGADLYYEFGVSSDAPVSRWSRPFIGSHEFIDGSLELSPELTSVSFQAREGSGTPVAIADVLTLNTWVVNNISALDSFQIQIIALYTVGQFGDAEITLNFKEL